MSFLWLTTITLVGGGARDGGAKAGSRCEPGLLCLATISTLLVAEWGPRLLERCPEVWSELAPVPLSVCSSMTSTGTLAPERSSAGVRGPCVGTWCRSGHGLYWSGQA